MSGVIGEGVSRFTRALVVAIAAAICASPVFCQGTTTLKSISYAPDITVSLGGVTVPGGALAQEDLTTGAVSLVTNVPSLPDGAHIVAYQPASGGGALYAFDTTVAFGSLTVPRGDVVELGSNGSTYTIVFDAAANGIPDGTMVDAVAVASNGNLLLSFDTTVTLGALTATPRDLVLFNPTSSNFSLFFSGAANGIADGIALDGAQLLPSGHLLLSFDVSGSAGGVQFRSRRHYGLRSLRQCVDRSLSRSDAPSRVGGGPVNGFYATLPAPVITTYTVTFSAGPNGTVMGLTTQTVLSGGSTSLVYVLPDPDAYFEIWVDGSGNYFSGDYGLVVNNVTANQSFTALFGLSGLSRVDGTCGKANGRNLSSAPGGQDLCYRGTASAVSGSGPWNWSCGGQNGGGTASCSANLPPPCDGTQPCISTVAGGGPNNMPALSSPLYYPSDVAADSKGNFYIATQEANRVFKVDASGTLTVFAGNGESYGTLGDEGPAVNAEIGGSMGITVDKDDNVYIEDGGGSVRKVTTDGIIHTVVGNDNGRGYYGDGVDARLATLGGAQGLAIDHDGNLFIADTGDNVIREVTTDGNIHTVAGIPGVSGFSGDGGPATSAVLNYPSGVAVDNNGNVFVADFEDQRIRMFTVGGNISTVAGNQTKESNGSYWGDFQGDGGPATQALLSFPDKVAVDGKGNVYISDFFNNRVRRFTVGGNIETIAGNASWGYTGDGPATSVGLWGPSGMTFDKDGNLLIGDQWDGLVRKLDFNSGNLVTVAGNHLANIGGDGYAATQASFTTGTTCYYMDVTISRNCPRVTLDSASNLYIADSLNHSIRKVNAQTGIISTIAGSTSGIAGYSGNGGQLMPPA
jgi:sugar lactone lactonase YvrE